MLCIMLTVSVYEFSISEANRSNKLIHWRGQSDQLMVTSSHRNSIIVTTIIILLHMLLFKFPDLHGASILPCLENDNTNIMNKHLHLRWSGRGFIFTSARIGKFENLKSNIVVPICNIFWIAQCLRCILKASFSLVILQFSSNLDL